MRFSLETMSRLAAALGHPERTFQAVLVAGTNGKGSVTAMVHHALVSAGHPAARYISPHLERLEERFVVGPREVTTAELDGAAAAVRAAADGLQQSGVLAHPPTYFEGTTAMAFELFRRADVRIAVLEVGLGGRLDATNLVDPIAVAITSVDLDHQAQLGDTFESIALEKAGVIRPGIPVVAGAMPAAAERVVREVCASRRARWLDAAQLVDLDGLLGGREPGLRGEHQRGNARVAACLLAELDRAGIRVDTAAVRAGLTEVSWPGRLECFHHGGAEVLLDAAHNPAGARALAAYMAASGWAGAGLVFGALEDKDVAAMLAELGRVCSAIICTTPASPRAMPAARVAEHARAAGRSAVAVVPDPVKALAAAAGAHARVVAAGSIFLIGPLRGILRG
jgi:dihydrofolate synthase / folylpolyglutamate synthase